MIFGIPFKQGDIVIVPFPFTDLTAVRQRPVLIISNDAYNNSTEDIIVCGITSNIKDAICSVYIDKASLSEGTIPVASRIKVDKIFTLRKSLIKKKVAAVKQNVLNEVKKELLKVLG